MQLTCAAGVRPTGLLAAALALPLLTAPTPAPADTAPDGASVALKLLDYREHQPGADRVKVLAPALQLQLPLGSRWSTTATLVHDAISGASPAYHSSGLTRLKDYRRAYDLAVSRYFDNSTVTLGGSVSSEADYFSRSLSLQASLSSDDRNTTWTAGLGASADRINPVNQVVVGEHKRSQQALLGMTQVLGVHDTVQINLTLTRGRGYFSDPYKVFDERPRQRDQRTLQLRWNHHLPATGTTLRSSWRWYDDSFGVQAHTLGLELVQPLPGGWTLTPLMRLHTQSAASFYAPADPGSEPFAPNPPAGALHYTQDQRLSAFGARTLGLKLAWQINAGWTADIKVERYAQRGSWRLFGSGSNDIAPFTARSIQAGLAHRF